MDHEKLPWWEQPGAPGENRTKEQYAAHIAALKEPAPRRVTDGPREYLKIKYSAPPGTCKCGNCQLVPPAALEMWAQQLEALRAILKGIAEYSSRDGAPLGAIDRLIAIQNTAERATRR